MASFAEADERHLAFKLYSRLKEASKNPVDGNRWDEVDQYIEERLDFVRGILEDYSRKDVHPNAAEFHMNLLRIFQLYHEGLEQIKLILPPLRGVERSMGDEASLLCQSLELIFQCDLAILEMNSFLKIWLEENPHECIL